jgi:hypothetical protein
MRELPPPPPTTLALAPSALLAKPAAAAALLERALPLLWLPLGVWRSPLGDPRVCIMSI